MVDISEQSLVFHLYFQKKKLARTFKIFQAQKMFFEFANNAPNVVVEKVSFQEFHQMHQNWILHFKFVTFKCFIQKFWSVLMSSDSHQQKTIQYNFTKWVLYWLMNFKIMILKPTAFLWRRRSGVLGWVMFVLVMLKGNGQWSRFFVFFVFLMFVLVMLQRKWSLINIFCLLCVFDVCAGSMII